MNEADEVLLELEKHNKIWNEKLLLREIYKEFYELIKNNLFIDSNGKIVELGSGIGKIKEVIQNCICTDRYDSNYVNHSENAYELSYMDSSVSNLILFDVFHHLQYPGDALKEFHRVLSDSGRLLLFEPHLSLLGIFVYGLFHPEPLKVFEKIEWSNSNNAPMLVQSYYAAQGNATRIFCWENSVRISTDWNVLKIIKIPAISYVASGGYTGTQLYPSKFLSFMRKIDKLCTWFPAFFATRMLIVLEKK